MSKCIPETQIQNPKSPTTDLLSLNTKNNHRSINQMETKKQMNLNENPKTK